MKNQQGLVNITVVLGIGLFALSLALAVISGVLGGLSANNNLLKGDQAFYTADSAAAEGMYQLINEPGFTGGTGINANNIQSSNIAVAGAWPYLDIRAMAANQAVRNVINKVTLYPAGNAFNHALYSKKRQTNISGSTTITGKTWGLDNISISNSSQIVGDTSTSSYWGGVISNPARVVGEVRTQVDIVWPPTINMDPYKNLAVAAGTSFTSASTAANYLNNQTRSGVVYVSTGTGALTLSGNNTNFTGSLVVKGNLAINGGTFKRLDNLTPVIFVSGSLSITNANIDGLVIVNMHGGAVNLTSVNIFGEVLILYSNSGSTTVSGNSTITYDPAIGRDWFNLIGIDPDDIEGMTPIPALNSWREE